jgi:hypothetical protein
MSDLKFILFIIFYIINLRTFLFKKLMSSKAKRSKAQREQAIHVDASADETFDTRRFLYFSFFK